MFKCLTLLIAVLLLQSPVLAQATNEQLTQDIRNRVDSDSYETLLVGEKELILIVRESTTPITKGVAVMLGDSGQGPMSHNGMAALAEQLNQYGWVTMLMPAPTTGFLPLVASDDPAQESGSEQDMSAQPDAEANVPAAPHARQVTGPIPKQRFDEHEGELMAQMQAIVTRTRDYPGFFLVVASGTTSAWLTKIYAEQKLGAPDALVIMGPFWPQRELNKQIPQWIGDTQMPVLDIYSPWDNDWSKDTIAQRNIAAVKSVKMHYRQREIIGQPMDAEQYALLGKEIYGWLTYMGW